MTLSVRNVQQLPLVTQQADDNFNDSLRGNPAKLKQLLEFQRVAAGYISAPIIRKTTPVAFTRPTCLGQIVVIEGLGAFISFGYSNTSWSAL